MAKKKAPLPAPEVKGKKGQAMKGAEPSVGKGKKSKSSTPEVANGEPQKPQRGLAIGDNFGWTGKLPATLLYEFCQKQKWNKVIFDMKKTPKGFIGIADLSWENPKTKEVIHVKMMPDTQLLSPRETTNEARHFAATYAMHRLNYVKNLRMVLPTIFRDFWSDLENHRQELLKKSKTEHDKIYNANPFQVYLEEKAANEKKAKEREAKANNDAKINAPKTSISIGTQPQKKTVRAKQDVNKIVKPRTPTVQPTFSKKAWETAPFVDFPVDIRTSIERQIKDHITWIQEEEEASFDEQSRQQWRSDLIALEFRESHVDEALTHTHSFTDALEWLLFHIPDDDLPVFFAKREEDTGVSLKISKDIQTEYLLQRLAHSGCDKDDIIEALRENDGKEVETAIKLCYNTIDYVPERNPKPDSKNMWVEEIESIQMIGSNNVEFIDDEKRIVTASLNVEGLENDILLVKLFMPEAYPDVLPGVQIVINNLSHKLANYIKLAIIRRLLNHVLECNLLGECYIYFMIEWLESNIGEIIKNPGPLSSNSQAISPKNKTSKNKILKKSSSRERGALTDEDIEQLKKEFAERNNSIRFKKSVEERAKLPAWNKREKLVSIINSNKVTLVTGETGSGKSTQIVQFIMDDLNAKGDFSSTIICTQPRRISTIGLADRISEERILNVGKEVGYIIRGENKTCKATRLLFVTTGVLLRMLQSLLSNDKSADVSMFDRLQYIFIDEVHERSVDSDFLLIILKKIMHRFPTLKIVLMSATINTEAFMKFFPTQVNHIHIEGRTFPIEDQYLDTILHDLDYSFTNYNGEVIKPKADSHYFKTGTANYDLVAKLCLLVDERLRVEGNSGSILIFLPGVMEINKCIQKIESEYDGQGIACWCLPLHSTLSSKDQTRVFKKPPAGTRKIVVSTNIAETSITIPDCVVVIDSGRSKSVFFDPQANVTKLVESWCSRAEMSQRRGRSGRIQNGTCYHLYTKETFDLVTAQPIPEIKRVRLDNLYLIVKAMGIKKVDEFLSDGLDPPDMLTIKKTKAMLEELGALDTSGANETLTHLGRYLSFIPTDLQLGKLLILGCIFSCVEICLTLAAISSTGSPFLNNFEKSDDIRLVKARIGKQQGDYVASALAYHEYALLDSKEKRKYIAANHLSYLKLQEIQSTRTQYVLILKEIGFLPFKYHKDKLEGKVLNKNNDNFDIVRAIITGSFTPQLARVQLPDAKYAQTLGGAVEIDPDAKKTKFWIRNEKYIEEILDSKESKELPATRVFIHPSSMLFSTSPAGASIPNLEDLTLEDGSIDMQRAREQFDMTPAAALSSKGLHKSPFVVYNSSSFTSKHFLREITPTSTITALLFGGDISYDLSVLASAARKCPGIVLDRWQPIRTWCKNGVLIKRLRQLLDRVIDNKLSSTLSEMSEVADEAVIDVVVKVLTIETRQR